MKKITATYINKTLEYKGIYNTKKFANAINQTANTIEKELNTTYKMVFDEFEDEEGYLVEETLAGYNAIKVSPEEIFGYVVGDTSKIAATSPLKSSGYDTTLIKSVFENIYYTA